MSAAHVTENEVLRPIDPEKDNEEYENEWPDFTLENSIVTDKGGNVVSVFEAAADKLLIVSGELKRTKENQKFFLPGKTKKLYHIEIPSVSRYAFGFDKLGALSIWPAGRSGWYKLKPAAKYKETFEEMLTDVKMWFYILDNKKLHDLHAKDVFLAFGKKSKCSPEIAEETFLRHATFIMDNMKKMKGGSWSKKPLYQYLKRHMVKASSHSRLVSESAQSTAVPQQKESKKRGRPPKQEIETPPVVKRRASEQKSVDVPTTIAELKRVEGDAAVLWKFILRISEQKIPPRKLKIDHLSKILANEFIFDNEAQAASYLRFQGPYLVKYMQERRQRKVWLDSPIYSDLMASSLSPQMKSQASRIQLQVRDYRLAADIALGGLDIYVSSDEDLDMINLRHSKSVLRPRSAGKRGKSYTREVPESQDDEETSGSTTPRKRKGIEEDLPRLRKRRALSATQSSDGTSQRAGSTEPAEKVEPTLTLRWKTDSTPSRNAPHLVTGREHLDPEEIQVGDVWQCDAPNCMQRIFGASGELGQRLINQHIEEHEEEDTKPEMDLVMLEMKKTNLPVTNLIRRIREFSAAKELTDTIAGADEDESSLPQPQRIRRLFA